jgi:phenylalanyl-tRNA synthetase beta chain
MKISRTQLQAYFKEQLPSLTEIADAYTFHSFEIDSIEGEVLDVKVLPNRAADCNSIEGLARELAAILNLPTSTPRTSSATTLPPVSVSLMQINGILGSDFTHEEVVDVFKRLDLPTRIEGNMFTVTPPASRPDLAIPEDLVEEVGRIIGYDRLPLVELPSIEGAPDQARFHGIERMKDQLVEQGFTEVSTQSFAPKGDITLANPLDKTKPALRTTLENNLKEALVRAKQYAPLLLAPKEKPKLFEVGTVFPKAGEYLELRMTERVPAWGLPAQAGDAAGLSDNLSTAKLEEYGKEYTPKQYTLSSYKPFSLHPFIVRDVALWVSKETTPEDIEKIIRANAGELAQKIYLFDTFEKDDKKSFAFRMVLQSFERTLEDAEANAVYDRVVKALEAANSNWQARV